ncbi:hypothetical protein CYMTET_45248 [Cymbomonas tetramitiformis]|uniref:AAA+ ATPase domain-containing protein n=1 Tax=Cymbomonas tetramitiformis TaxID=36881 RepID=A0AAE0C0B8_9CHLO|nr:hypothetical protein CYMTET_45248 [Cymbomonas tetramitiformis]
MERKVKKRLPVLREMVQEVAAERVDMVHKAELYNECRQEHAELTQMSHNIKDLGGALDMPAAFLGSVDGELDDVSASLDRLQEEAGWKLGGPELVQLMKDSDTGLKQLQAQRRRRLCSENLRYNVYVPAVGVGPGDDGKFETKYDNPPVDLLCAVNANLLERSDIRVLLLSGPAGSGKSTFLMELAKELDMEYARQSESAGGMEVLVLSVSLSSLQNPLTNLFYEALTQKGLRDTEIDELRNLVHAGNVGLIFLLDDYEKMPKLIQFKNLYKSNRLEQYRPQQPIPSGAAAAYPKVIITARTEMLSRDEYYYRAFLPIEEGSSEHHASRGFKELRITAFNEGENGDQIKRFIHGKVALDLRSRLERQFGTIEPLSKEAATELQSEAARSWSAPEGTQEDTRELSIDAACRAVTASRGRSGSLEHVKEYVQKIPCSMLKNVKREAQPMFQVMWVLAAALVEVPADLKDKLKQCCEDLQTEKVWVYQDYLRALDSFPELRAHAASPLFVGFAVQILPALEVKMQNSDAGMKAKLLMLLEEDAAQMVWECISRWRGAEDSDNVRQVQAAMESGLFPDGMYAIGSLMRLSEAVAGVLKEQGLLLKQPKLVRMAQDHLWATQQQARSGLLEDIEEESLLQDTISKIGIIYVLKSALCRPNVRQLHIYALFVEFFIKREAEKAQGMFDTATLVRESRAYSQRLAMQMTSYDITRVLLGSDNELFHVKSVWDVFVADTALTRFAQQCAPVKFNGRSLSFLATSMQAYFCAAGLQDNLHQILHALAVPLEELTEELLQQELIARHGDALTLTPPSAPPRWPPGHWPPSYCPRQSTHLRPPPTSCEAPPSGGRTGRGERR